MIEFKHENYKIGLCLNIEEWAKEFYDMPDDAIIDNVEEMQRECMGFSDITGRELWIFLPKKYEPLDFESTIAHEVGHIIDFKHKENHEQIEANDELHEEKANYYEGYYMTVRRIVDKANRALAEHLHENAVLHLADVTDTVCHNQSCTAKSQRNYCKINNTDCIERQTGR